MAYIGYLLFRLFVWIFSLIPFSILYILADILAVILPLYRKKIVIDNLKLAFPQKSINEINQITKKYYKNLADVILEAIKGFSMSEIEVKRRFVLENPIATKTALADGKSVIALAAHYNNWEWGALGVCFLIQAPIFILYKPLSNQYIDHFVRTKRKKWGANLYPIQLTQKLFKENTSPAIFILAGDQSPSNLEKAIWVDFFGIDTACLHGAETYAQNPNFVVIFYELYRTKRGFYEMKEIPIPYNPQKSTKGELTQKYMKLVESEILKEPAYWLWSHKRWKHRR